jgi:trans-aconitate 2-methyltransferase
MRFRFIQCMFFLSTFLVMTHGVAAPKVDMNTVMKVSEDQYFQLINSDKYSDSSSPEQKWTEEVLQHIPLIGNESVLDIGCGEGKICYTIAKLVPLGKVIGIDPREEFIKQAQKKYGSESLSHLYFYQLNPESISYDEEFDLVLTFSWLHYVKDQQKVVQNIFKSLKKGGRLAMRFFIGNNSTRLDHAIDVVAQKDEWKPYFFPANEVFSLADPKEFQTLLKNTGFLEERVEIYNNREIFVTKDIFLEWIQPWLKAIRRPQIENLSTDEYNHFANDVLKQYLEWHPSDSQGYIHFENSEIEIEAKKP